MFKHLVFEDRVKIETLLKMGENFSTIANQLGVSRALISIEIKRSLSHCWPNKYKAPRYDARHAQCLSDQRRTKNRHKNNSKLTSTRLKYIKQRILQDKWSPKQIVHGTPNLDVGVSTIYTWINRNQIPGVTNKDLRHKGHRYKRALSARTWKSLRSYITDKRQSIRDHTIATRPDVILKRLRFGDLELDGVESRQSNALVLTFVERKTRYAVAIKVPSKHANDIKLGIDTFMSQHQDYVKSITCDRGSEFLAASTQ